MRIETDNETLTQLLGYLKWEMWEEAVKSEELCPDKELVSKLVEIQDRVYGTNLCDIDEA